MKRRSNIMSYTMMLVVLLLGVFMPSLPDLDDGDDNVGCAAVMPLAPHRSVSDATSDQRRLHRSERSTEVTTTPVLSQAGATEVSAPATISLSQVSPPLRA